MLKAVLGMLIGLGLCLGAVAQAPDKEKGTKDTPKSTSKDQKKAQIVKVDPRAKTVTVKMKDEKGKEVQRTFRLAEDIRYLDSTGRAAAVDVFQSGNYVLIVEREGRITEMRKHDRKDGEKSGKESTKDREKRE
jgi:hypothetical protein